MSDLLRNVPQWIQDRDEVRAILDLGRDPEHYPSGQFRGYFATVEEIAPLHEARAFRRWRWPPSSLRSPQTTRAITGWRANSEDSG